MVIFGFFKDPSICSMEERLVKTYTDDGEISWWSIITIHEREINVWKWRWREAVGHRIYFEDRSDEIC